MGECVEAWCQAAAPHVDLADLQTQPIWQPVRAEGAMAAQAAAKLCHLDLDRVLRWFDRPLPRRVGELAQGEPPRTQFLARLRQAPVPAFSQTLRPPGLPWHQKVAPNAAEAFAIAGLAQGHVELCVDILVPSDAPQVPKWSQILGAAEEGILPSAESVHALMWQLSVRAAEHEQAYLPALSHLLKYVFEAVMCVPHAAPEVRVRPLPDVAAGDAAVTPVVSWAQACMHFDFEDEEGPGVRRAQAAIVRSFRQAMAQWLSVRVPKLKWAGGASAQQFGKRVDTLWAAFVGGVFVPTTVKEMCNDSFGRLTQTKVVHDRFRLFCGHWAPWRNKERVAAFIDARIADDIITPLQRGEVAPRRPFSAQILREAHDRRHFGRRLASEGIGPKSQGRRLAETIVHAEPAQ